MTVTQTVRFALLVMICITAPSSILAKQTYDWRWPLIVDRAATVCLLRVDQVSEFAVWGTVRESIKGCVQGQRVAFKLQSSSRGIPLVLPGDEALVAGFRAPQPIIFKLANIRTHDRESPLTWREWDIDAVVPFEIAWSRIDEESVQGAAWHESAWPTLQAALTEIRAFARSEPASRELEVMRQYARSAIYTHLDMHPAQEKWLSAIQNLDRLEDFLRWCISQTRVPSSDKDVQWATEGVIDSLNWGGLETLRIIEQDFSDDPWLQTTIGKRTVQVLFQLNYPELTRQNATPSGRQPPSVESILATLDPASVTYADLEALEYAAMSDFPRALAWLNAAGQFGEGSRARDVAYQCTSLILRYIPATADRKSLLVSMTRHESVMVTVVAASLLMFEDMTEATAVLRAAAAKTCGTSAAFAALTLARWGSKEQVDVCLQKLSDLSNGGSRSSLGIQVEDRLILLLANSQRKQGLDRRLIREIWLAGGNRTTQLTAWWSSVKSNAKVGDPLVFQLKKPAQ